MSRRLASHVGNAAYDTEKVSKKVHKYYYTGALQGDGYPG